ncbi:acyltransferase family protein [Salinarimonas soli]|uniref:Acyltransferase n=1 Tax=Salinarimonas soli TaxID=1638099 RepID=A0A5B2VBU0_9HYPH|nr:acyltransferase [Salinarimonas soli]KAA2236923.1 acyltransferase [Salinarimonas soli]
MYRPFGVFRTFLALLVIVQHGHHVAPAGWVLGRFGSGTLAVIAFFSLSGFVITEAAVRFYSNRPWAFIANRGLRIVPQYVLAVLLSMAAILICSKISPEIFPNGLVGNTSEQIFSPYNIMMNIINIFPGVRAEPPFVPYSWALRVEITFYILLMAGIWLNVLAPNNGIKIFGTTILAVFMLYILGIGPSISQYIPIFAFGAVLYRVVAAPSVASYLTLGALLSVSFYICIAVTLPEALAQPFTIGERSIHLLIFFGLMLAPWWLATCRVGPAIAHLDRRIGDLSFPIYLQQYAILVFAKTFMPVSYTTFIFVVIAAIILAWCSDAVVEAPLRILRDRIRGRSLQNVAAVHNTVMAPGSLTKPEAPQTTRAC